MERLQADAQDSAMRLHAMHLALFAAYGQQHWWPAETHFEMIIGAYLTQATAWKSVERSLENLRSAGALTIEGVRSIPETELRELIRPSGFVQRKTAALKAFVRFLDESYAGLLENLRRQIPTVARKQMLALPGVGEETADAILLYALDHPAIVVDEYLRRVITRHALLQGKATPADMRAAGIAMLQRRAHSTELEDAKEFHALIVEAGKRHCGAVARCTGCPLQPFLA